MKIQEFKKLIREEIRKVLNEENAPKDSIFNDKIDTALGKISGYDGMQFNKEKNIVTVTFTDTASRAKGMNLLNKLFPDFKYTTDDVDIIDDEGMLAKIYDLDITK
jgi:hypothetical protein